MSEITPTNSLLTAISQYTETRKTQGGQSKETEEQKLAAERAQQAKASESKRVDVSSNEDVLKAQANVRAAETESPFRREAPNAGHDNQPVPPGQFIDIKV